MTTAKPDNCACVLFFCAVCRWTSNNFFVRREKRRAIVGRRSSRSRRTTVEAFDANEVDNKNASVNHGFENSRGVDDDNDDDENDDDDNDDYDNDDDDNDDKINRKTSKAKQRKPLKSKKQS